MGVIHLKFNSILCLLYFSKELKIALDKMIPKPGKNQSKVESYRSISLFLTFPGLFEKLLISKMTTKFDTIG